ncbi:hypothetical protein CVT24_006845 [Panaeolus cyanescens]|uniref:Zn(2)-C6 fungal-type domain-containing protein n=1 Tax=Panaeolus cyanescens TaxID=181874 RepID=A0A409YS21_9AGAR|nr:hypothetical protein CVT24_006845 [Panaeolus cyanescens]
MTNAYTNQQWNQNNYTFPQLQLEQEYDFAQRLQQQYQQQQQQQQQQPPYRFGQQQNPPSASSLHSNFQSHQQSHSRSSSFGASTTQAPQQTQQNGYSHSVYPSQQPHNPPASQGSIPNPYRINQTPFTFGASTTAATITNNFTASPPPIHTPFPPSASSSSYYHSTTDLTTSEPQPKRHHSQAFKDDFNQDDHDSEMNSADPKDPNKSKLARACQRCKNLKVKCEAKTETDPCKRCFNGGHECVVPGRKVRRTPPKREHLLNQIQTQAKEIERLMGLLENVTVSKEGQPSNGVNLDTNMTGSHLQSPLALSPSSASGPFFGSTDQVLPQAENDDAVKAVQDWISKARESLNEFGTFIDIGTAGTSKRLIVDADLEEGESSEDEFFTDVPEDFETGDLDDHYDVAIQDSEGAPVEPGAANRRGRPLHHKPSGSSLGTSAAGEGPAKSQKKTMGEAPANLPVEASPFGLFGNLALKGPRSRAASVEPGEADNEQGPGIANEDFFKSTPSIARPIRNDFQAPAILARGIITPTEAEHLFKIYFDNMNLSVSLLDPVLYTAQRTFYRSPFLFTVICAIASRFYSARNIYPQMMQFAQLAAGTALISGTKNVEMCSAYILLSLYPVPARKWEDQRSWLYLGLAIRTATDLNLHLPTTAKPLNENHAREMLNRTRVWLNCFNLDRSTGSQYGKPPIINPRDYIANHCETWWQNSPVNMRNFDIHIVAYNAELKVMSNFIAKLYSDPHHPTGLNKEEDFERIATETDDELKALQDRWFAAIRENTDMSDPQNRFRTGLLRLAYSYSRLIALSYGFQHAFGKNDGIDENPFLMRCLKAASDVVDSLVSDICRPGQMHYLRHGPEAQSVFVTFASAFLVKLLQPKFATYLAPQTRVEIRALVQRVIDLLGSPEVAIDERHGPKIYSRFLEKLLAKPMARLDPMSPGSSPNMSLPRSKASRRTKSASGSTHWASGPGSAGIGGSFAQPPDSASSQTFELPPVPSSHPSPATSTSLSPPPMDAALSTEFDVFVPSGPIDAYTAAGLNVNLNLGTDLGMGVSGMPGVNGGPGDKDMNTSGMFYPELPFDDAIISSIQDLTNPSGWQDISLPGFNWMAQFQQNLGLDLNNPETFYSDQNMPFLTGPDK